MKASELRIGDRIRIVRLPGAGVKGYYLHRDTKRVFTKLIERGTSVRIARIEHGNPWYDCRVRKNNGQWESHSLAVCDLDDNWVLVRRRGSAG